MASWPTHGVQNWDDFARLRAYVDGIGFNNQTGSYTLVLTDSGKAVSVTSASPAVVTVPANASVAFPVGTMVPLRQGGAGQVTVSAGSGVAVNGRGGANKLAGQYAWATLVQVAANVWDLFGDTTT